MRNGQPLSHTQRTRVLEPEPTWAAGVIVGGQAHDALCGAAAAIQKYYNLFEQSEVASKQAQLVCTSELDDVAPPNQAQQVAAWRCNAKGATDLAESPPPWVLGKATCIETLGGYMTGGAFRACAP